MPDKTHSRKSKGIKRNDADSKKMRFSKLLCMSVARLHLQ